jgi:hypothetical protein
MDGQLLLASGHLVVLSGEGDLALVGATPDRHEEWNRRDGRLATCADADRPGTGYVGSGFSRIHVRECQHPSPGEHLPHAEVAVSVSMRLTLAC